MLVQAAVDVAKEDDTGLTVLSDKQINSAILNSTGIDITTLDKAAAKNCIKTTLKTMPMLMQCSHSPMTATSL